MKTTTSVLNRTNRQNRTVANEQRLESQRQQDSSRLGWAIVILVAVLLVIAAIYYLVIRHMGEDWRLIPQ